MDFTGEILPIIVQGLMALLIPLLGAVAAYGVRFLSALSASTESSTLERTAANVGARLITQVDQAIDLAEGVTQGALAKAQRPESPQGMVVTAEEWDAILDELTTFVVNGMGTSWMERLISLIGAATSPAPVQEAAARAEIKGAIATRFAQRVDVAVANQLRSAPSDFLKASAQV